jgi:2-(3-amino-3-carboxypropyl)histidine synthase
LELARLIESETDALAILSADPCYGACDLALDETKHLNVDLMVHYGHSAFQSKTEATVVHVEARSCLDVNSAVKKALPLIKNLRRIGLATTAQHVHRLSDAKRILTESGRQAFLGRASGRVKHDGQVLGCDFSTAKAVADEVDGFLFIGGGDFHPLGLALTTGKPVVTADPYLNKARRVDSLLRRALKQRWAAICKAREAATIGVIVGLKSGQLNLEKAFEIKREIEKHGKKAVILCMREITPDNIAPLYMLDALIDTACPRIAIDDASKFRQPILTLDEAEVMLGRRSWEDHIGAGAQT